MAVRWLTEIDTDDVETVGGKGASLGELTAAGLPVPPAFVVTADTYRSFIESAEIDEELFGIVDVDVDDSAALSTAAERAQELLCGTPLPDALREEIAAAYDELGENGSDATDDPFVAVRSSATAEDLPEASFAGQQETFLNVTGDALLDRVRECWASLFTQRAIYYRQEQGFDHESVDVAVVVQSMVDAEKSGVVFTSHPSTGDPTTIVEAAWGLGEAVVSGAVSPDNYIVSRRTGSADVRVAQKKVEFHRDERTGETVEREVPEELRDARVLTDAELERLVALGERIEAHYGTPQDVEWAITGIDDPSGTESESDDPSGTESESDDPSGNRSTPDDGTVYVLQSRPITTIAGESGEEIGVVETVATGVTDGGGGGTVADRGEDEATAEGSGGDQVEESANASSQGEVIVSGLGSSPGRVSGAASVVTRLDDLDRVDEGDVIVTEMTTPDMVPAMKRAVGIVTDEGGMTSHAAIVSRELGVPAVVGTTNATTALRDGQVVTLDGEKGTVLEGSLVEPDEEPEPVAEMRPKTPVKPMTATEVHVNVSIPEAAERAAATGADGVGLLRIEHLVLTLEKTPARFVGEHGADAYVGRLIDGVRTVADEFYPRPVRVRTLDAPTDEFRQLDGGEDEPVEHNPMLGYRGIRRSLDRPDVFAHELEAFRRLYGMGYDNVELMLPLVADAEDVLRAKALIEAAGIDTGKRRWGVMIETPAAALSIEEIAETGIDFVSFGTNDLTQYTLAVDRNNEHVASRFDELHPALCRLLGDVIGTCRDHGVDTSICGQAASRPEMIRFLVTEGIDSISANVDAVRDAQHEVKRVEQKLLLESIR